MRPWLERSVTVTWECPVWPETGPGSAGSVPQGVRILALTSNLCLGCNSSPIHLKHLTRLSLPKESTGRKNPLPQFACTHQLPATLLITHCPCKLIQLRETSLDDYKKLQSQYCFRPAESKFIKHLLFKAAVVINACLHL